MLLPVAEVFVTEEARDVVLRSRVGIPVESSISECVRDSFVRLRMWPLDVDGESFRSGSPCDFPCQLERLEPLKRAEHRMRHRSVTAAVVVARPGGGWLDGASAVDHGQMKVRNNSRLRKPFSQPECTDRQ